MLFDIPRETFLCLCQIKSATLDERVRRGEAAFALGVERPARVGYYLLLDVFAMILASILNCRCGLSLKAAVEVVREHWSGWLDLISEAERWHEKYPTTDPMLFIAVAWLPLEPGQSERERPYRILLGRHGDIVNTLGGVSVHAANFVSIALLLHVLRANAEQASFTLPARLTIADGEPGCAQWREEIAAYQERAGVRVARLAPA